MLVELNCNFKNISDVTITSIVLYIFTKSFCTYYFTSTSHQLSYSFILFYISFTLMEKLKFRKVTNSKL
uniref:Testis cDNA clone: QtsA-14312, similar to human chromosome 9 open reading frame 5 (C9orf5) n=1 Tax=Macaca fascicularis TaxID=9541 RepID=Q4R3T5_MACFA|nr:unnamed protein product [Macaca fascicularis]